MSAEAPFDDPQADLILQSSDGVHFRVFKLILSFASPVIVDMLSIPSPLSQKPHDEDQVAHLTEQSTALDVVLSHIYPVQLPNGDTLLYANILAEFARKYKVESLDRFIMGYHWAISQTVSSVTLWAFMPLPLHMDTTISGQSLLGHV
jgi:hypothetical protein